MYLSNKMPSLVNHAGYRYEDGDVADRIHNSASVTQMDGGY